MCRHRKSIHGCMTHNYVGWMQVPSQGFPPHPGNAMMIGGDGMPCMPHAGHDAGAIVAPEQVPNMASKGVYPGNPSRPRPGESAMMAKVGENVLGIWTM